MKKLDVAAVAFTVGIFVGGWHVVWSLLVLFGWVQGLADFIFSIHFLNNPFQVAAFDLAKAATLVIVTFIVGYVGGFLFASIWNKFHV